MKCSSCNTDVTILTPHEQYLFGVSGLCPECQDQVFEESYREQDDLRCCRQCDFHDWVEESLICGKTHKAVGSTAICDGFKEVTG